MEIQLLEDISKKLDILIKNTETRPTDFKGFVQNINSKHDKEL